MTFSPQSYAELNPTSQDMLDAGYRLDLLVEHKVIVEFQAVESRLPIHHAQLLTYLRLANKPLGLLIKFNTVHLKDGIKRMIHRL